MSVIEVRAAHRTWMEFGVNSGGTITVAANWRTRYCPQAPMLYGFDTFTGPHLAVAHAWRAAYHLK